MKILLKYNLLCNYNKLKQIEMSQKYTSLFPSKQNVGLTAEYLMARAVLSKFLTHEDVFGVTSALEKNDPNIRVCNMVAHRIIKYLIELNNSPESLVYKKLFSVDEKYIYHQCIEDKQNCACKNESKHRYDLWYQRNVTPIYNAEECLSSVITFGGKYGFILSKFVDEIYFTKFIIMDKDVITDMQLGKIYLSHKKFKDSNEFDEYLTQENIFSVFQNFIRKISW
jgi:hypothetical protein